MKGIVKKIGDEITVSCTPHRRKAKKRKPKNPDNERTPQSISAAKKRIHELTVCNDWEYMVTLEFSPKLIKLLGGGEAAIQKAKQWFANLKKRTKGFENFAWLLVPEPHTDRRKKLHLHGFIAGIPETELIEWSKMKGRKPASVRARIKAGDTVYNWPGYQQKFGFCMLTEVGGGDGNSKDRKNRWALYITKSLREAAQYRKSGQGLYFCSRGLERAEVVAAGTITAAAEEYVKANADKSYAHTAGPNEPIYGYTYVMNDDALRTQKIINLIDDE